MSKIDDTILDLDLDTVTGGQSHIPSPIVPGAEHKRPFTGVGVGIGGSKRPSLGQTIHKPLTSTELLGITGGTGPSGALQGAAAGVRKAAEAAIESTKIRPYLPNPHPDNLPKVNGGTLT